MNIDETKALVEVLPDIIELRAKVESQSAENKQLKERVTFLEKLVLAVVGYSEEEQPDEYSFKGEKKINCLKCHGVGNILTGTTAEKRCPECNGIGQVDTEEKQ